jgi:transcription termination factor NusB
VLEQIAHDVPRREMRELVMSLLDAWDLTANEIEEVVDDTLQRLKERQCT